MALLRKAFWPHRRSVTPATMKEIEEARDAQRRLQQQSVAAMRNWPRVHAAAGWAKEIRQTNHLVEDLRQIIGNPGER